MMDIGKSDFSATDAGSLELPVAASFPIVELRQYTLREGERDTLIGLFEREFIEPQEALGMKIIGTFRDLDRPNRFVWLRGFSDMDSRLAALSDFYSGPIWKAYRDQANATMIDSDNVLLLHAPSLASEFDLHSPRPERGERAAPGLVVATILRLHADPAAAAELFEKEVKLDLERAGIAPLGWFVPETLPNNFPRLPVREGETLLVWFAGFASPSHFARHSRVIADATAPLRHMLSGEAEVLRLEPTARSQLRGRGFPLRGTPHDFDFLLGRWSVTHRKLQERGTGSTDWTSYSGTAETRALIGGLCNVEEHRIAGSDSSGVAVRCFDRASGNWAIYWVSEREGRLEPPVVGAFSGDEGHFEGAHQHRGMPVKVRFLWRRLGCDSARWEQSFSYDEGRSWETNWIMEFERVL